MDYQTSFLNLAESHISQFFDASLLRYVQALQAHSVEGGAVTVAVFVVSLVFVVVVVLVSELVGSESGLGLLTPRL